MLLMPGVPTSRYGIAQEASSLRTLWVDHNRLSGCLPASWSYLRSIKGIDMRNNQLDCSLSSFLAPLLARKLNCHNAGVGCSELRELDVSQNHLYGSLPNTLVAFRGLSLLDVHSNNLTGTLPVLTPNFTELGAVLTGLRSLAVLPDGATSFGATQAFYQSLTPMSLSVFRAHDNPLIHGSIPESYGKLPYLDTLTVYGTAMQAPSNQLLPNFLKFSSITTVKINYLHLSCSLIVGAFRNMTVEVSGKYTNWDNCECDPGFYGRHGECVECPPSCPCLGSYLTGCYPSLRMDNTSSAEPSMSVLPCPRFGMTTQAATACNPDERPEFVCAAGHKNGSFMCSECSSGYFSTGYACSKCTTFLSDALPAVYVMCAVLRWVSCYAWVLFVCLLLIVSLALVWCCRYIVVGLVLISYLWRASMFNFKNQQGGRLLVTLWYLQVVGGLVITGNWVYVEGLFPVTAFISAVASFKLYASECMQMTEWWDDFTMMMAIPPGIVVLAGFLYLLMTKTGFASSGYTRPKCIHLVLMVMEFWYLPGAISILGSISCYLYDDANSSYHLVATPYVVCAVNGKFVSEFMPIYVVGFVLALLYLALYPLALAYLFFFSKIRTRYKTTDDPGDIGPVPMLFVQYKPHLYFWRVRDVHVLDVTATLALTVVSARCSFASVGPCGPQSRVGDGHGSHAVLGPKHYLRAAHPCAAAVRGVGSLLPPFRADARQPLASDGYVLPHGGVFGWLGAVLRQP